LLNFFPEIHEMISFLNAFGINQADYKTALDMLSEQKDLLFD